MKTQMQIYEQERRKIAAENETFLEIVKDGLTKSELKALIARRPALWKRFENWLEKLPSSNYDY
jgi:hypothetical protein